MYQVGQTRIFSLSSVSGTNVYSYVWKFWDTTVSATDQPVVAKTLNIGGNPTDDRSLYFTCTAVAIDAQEVVVNGSFQVNNPPSIVPSPTISANDLYLPFTTRLQVDAFDLDETLGDTPLQFDWYLGSNYLGNGTLGSTYAFDGTWTGNGSTVVQSLTAQPCYYDAVVSSDRVVRVYVQDPRGGITYVDFDLRGYVRPPPATGILASPGNLGGSASVQPIKRIGVGHYIDFAVDARDAANDALSFVWTFAGSNNWTVPEVGPGVTGPNPDGSFRSIYTKDISGEVVTTGTQKTATAVATVFSASERTDVSISVVLVQNSAPSNVVFSIKNAVTQVAINPSTPVAIGTKVEFIANVTDPDKDIAYVYWVFSTSSGTPVVNPMLIGPKVVVDTALWTGCADVLGSVTIVDRMLQPALLSSTPVLTLI